MMPANTGCEAYEGRDARSICRVGCPERKPRVALALTSGESPLSASLLFHRLLTSSPRVPLFHSPLPSQNLRRRFRHLFTRKFFVYNLSSMTVIVEPEAQLDDSSVRIFSFSCPSV